MPSKPPQRTTRSPTGAGSAGRADPSHEARCRRCGVSCHLAIPVNGTPVTLPGLRCKFLEPDGTLWRCTVYADRFTQAPWCHHADVAGPQGFLARDCPYVIATAGRHGKVTLSSANFDRLWPVLLAEIMRCGLPTWIHREAACEAIAAREGGRWQLRPRGDVLVPERIEEQG